MSANDWTPEEQEVARRVFDVGNSRSIEVLITSLRELSQQLDSPESVWKLHDYLSSQRFEYEGRCVFDESNALFVLADMVKLKLISLEDLQGLDQVKVGKVRAMSMF